MWPTPGCTPTTDWQEVTELIDTSCRQVALARMRKALDQQDA
jgi:hypothetical protein